jgi:multiple antibiotic resistance protein
MNTAALITFATAMFAILNPIGAVAIFAGLAGDRPEADRRSIAIRCGIAVAVILVGSVWAGEFVLGLFGVGIPSLQAAGGRTLWRWDPQPPGGGRDPDRLDRAIDAAQQAKPNP